VVVVVVVVVLVLVVFVEVEVDEDVEPPVLALVVPDVEVVVEPPEPLEPAHAAPAAATAERNRIDRGDRRILPWIPSMGRKVRQSPYPRQGKRLWRKFEDLSQRECPVLRRGIGACEWECPVLRRGIGACEWRSGFAAGLAVGETVALTPSARLGEGQRVVAASVR
jgi:hypothetical protein